MSNNTDTTRTGQPAATPAPAAAQPAAGMFDTPLASLAASAGSPFRQGDASQVELAELPFADIANLRGNPDDSAFSSAVQQALGLPLPRVPNTTAEGNRRIACWLGPDEWLLRSADSQPQGAGQIARQLEQALAGQFFATTDQSSAYSILQLRGPHARAVLNKGCPLELHPEVIRHGQCAQSHYFGASVLLRPLDADGQDWEIIVRRSFAEATAGLLLDAMTEYLQASQ